MVGETVALRVDRASEVVPSQQTTLICPGSAHAPAMGMRYLLIIFVLVLVPAADHTCPLSATLPPATPLGFCVWPASSSFI